MGGVGEICGLHPPKSRECPRTQVHQAARSSLPMHYCCSGFLLFHAADAVCNDSKSPNTLKIALALGFVRYRLLALDSYFLSRALPFSKLAPAIFAGLVETLKHYAAPDTERSRIFDTAAFPHGMRRTPNPREARRLGARGASPVSERKSYATPRVD
jgi:hypothetical protein